MNQLTSYLSSDFIPNSSKHLSILKHIEKSETMCQRQNAASMRIPRETWISVSGFWGAQPDCLTGVDKKGAPSDGTIALTVATLRRSDAVLNVIDPAITASPDTTQLKPSPITGTESIQKGKGKNGAKRKINSSFVDNGMGKRQKVSQVLGDSKLQALYEELTECSKALVATSSKLSRVCLPVPEISNGTGAHDEPVLETSQRVAAALATGPYQPSQTLITHTTPPSASHKPTSEMQAWHDAIKKRSKALHQENSFSDPVDEFCNEPDEEEQLRWALECHERESSIQGTGGFGR
jgi:hypothetical protein